MWSYPFFSKRLSKPLSFLLSIGTPKTGKYVNAEIIPGKCAEPPAPAIITAILFFSAFLAYRTFYLEFYVLK